MRLEVLACDLSFVSLVTAGDQLGADVQRCGLGPVARGGGSLGWVGVGPGGRGVVVPVGDRRVDRGPWAGPASAAMAASATPYVGWLSAAAGQAEAAASQARTAAMAFESALAGTVPTPMVAANRTTLLTLIATNILGQNTPAIAMTEFDYMEMWAADVAAMFGYHTGALSVASALPSFSAVPSSLPGLSSLTGLLPSGLAGLASQVPPASCPPPRWPPRCRRWWRRSSPPWRAWRPTRRR